MNDFYLRLGPDIVHKNWNSEDIKAEDIFKNSIMLYIYQTCLEKLHRSKNYMLWKCVNIFIFPKYQETLLNWENKHASVDGGLQKNATEMNNWCKLSILSLFNQKRDYNQTGNTKDGRSCLKLRIS